MSQILRAHQRQTQAAAAQALNIRRWWLSHLRISLGAFFLRIFRLPPWQIIVCQQRTSTLPNQPWVVAHQSCDMTVISEPSCVTPAIFHERQKACRRTIRGQEYQVFRAKISRALSAARKARDGLLVRHWRLIIASQIRRRRLSRFGDDLLEVSMSWRTDNLRTSWRRKRLRTRFGGLEEEHDKDVEASEAAVDSVNILWPEAFSLIDADAFTYRPVAYQLSRSSSLHGNEEISGVHNPVDFRVEILFNRHVIGSVWPSWSRYQNVVIEHVLVENLAEEGGLWEGAGEGGRLLRRVGWHALELRLTDDDTGKVQSSSVVVFQVQPVHGHHPRPDPSFELLLRSIRSRLLLQKPLNGLTDIQMSECSNSRVLNKLESDVLHDTWVLTPMTTCRSSTILDGLRRALTLDLQRPVDRILDLTLAIMYPDAVPPALFWTSTCLNVMDFNCLPDLKRTLRYRLVTTSLEAVYQRNLTSGLNINVNWEWIKGDLEGSGWNQESSWWRLWPWRSGGTELVVLGDVLERMSLRRGSQLFDSVARKARLGLSAGPGLALVTNCWECTNSDVMDGKNVRRSVNLLLPPFSTVPFKVLGRWAGSAQALYCAATTSDSSSNTWSAHSDPQLLLVEFL